MNILSIKIKPKIILRGSLAVEAAFVIPVFIIAMASAISVGSFLIFHMKLQNALCEEAKVLALRCFDGRNEAASVIEAEIVEYLRKSDTKSSVISGGLSGIDLSESFLNDKEYFVLVAKYSFVPVGGKLFGYEGIPISQKCAMHNWCGYVNGFFGEDNSGEYVYVTENSQVYHRNRECSHIRLSITIVNEDEIPLLRNTSGAKYYPCEMCHGTSDGIVYITKDGTKYHSSVMCSGLKRVVTAIRIEMIGDRRPCSRCAQ